MVFEDVQGMALYLPSVPDSRFFFILWQFKLVFGMI
jgi:hypothetical protein